MKRILVALGFAISCIVVVYGYFGLGFFVPQPPKPPAINCPELLDLGERELGEELVAEVPIKNTGGQPLIFGNVRTSCTCSGLNRKKGNDFYSVSEWTIQPGQEEIAYLRMTVRGVTVNSELAVAVRFTTNDPNWPERTLIAKVRRVWGGTTHSPESVNFGTVLVGRKAERIVHLWDASNPPRRIDRVVSTNPTEVGVKLLPPDAEEPPPYRIKPQCIGRILITATCETKSAIDTTISVYAKDDSGRHDDIRVTGRVSESHILTPAAVSLPRKSEGGSVYSLQCLCRSYDNSPFALLSHESPSGIELSYESGVDKMSHLIRVNVDRSLKPRAYEARIEIRTSLGARHIAMPIEVGHDGP